MDIARWRDDDRTERKIMSAEEILEAFGERVRVARRNRKITQIDLANKLGISFRTLNSIENAKNACGIDILFKIESELGPIWGRDYEGAEIR